MLAIKRYGKNEAKQNPGPHKLIICTKLHSIGGKIPIIVNYLKLKAMIW